MSYLNANKSSLDSSIQVKRKTRADDLDDRLAQAELLIEKLEEDMRNEGFKEVEKLNQILTEINTMKDKVKSTINNNESSLDSELKQVSTNSLILINNDKVKVRLKYL